MASIALLGGTGNVGRLNLREASVGVEFAHPRQTQLRQQRELRRNGQQQQRRPLDSDCAPQ